MALLMIEETRRCNLLTLQLVAAYFRIPAVDYDAIVSRLQDGCSTTLQVTKWRV